MSARTERQPRERQAIQRERQPVKLAVKLVVSYVPLHELELLACMCAAERQTTEKQSRELCVCSGSGAVSNLRAARGGNTRRRCMPARDSILVYEAFSCQCMRP